MTEYEKEEFEELKYIVDRLYCAIDDLKDKVDRLEKETIDFEIRSD